MKNSTILSEDSEAVNLTLDKAESIFELYNKMLD